MELLLTTAVAEVAGLTLLVLLLVELVVAEPVVPAAVRLTELLEL